MYAPMLFCKGRKMDCKKCGLENACKSPRMRPDVSSLAGDRAEIMFIGESPGQEEDLQGIPFVGRSGQLLREVVKEAIGPRSVVYTNVLACRPPENKSPTNKQISLCLPRLLDEIEEFDPRVLALLGNVPLRALLRESGITNWRGVVVERDGHVYVPTYHPAYILRNPQALDDMIRDFEKVVEVLEGKSTTDASSRYEIILVDTPKLAEKMHEEIKRAGVCSFDTEVSSLRVFDADQSVVMCSFAVDGKSSSLRIFDADRPTETFSFAVDGKAWAVLPHDPKIRIYVKRILRDPNIAKIGHNIKFDALAMLALWGVEIANVAGDSMLLSHILDSQPGRHGLKELAGRHLGMYDYDREYREYLRGHREADPARGGDLKLAPVEILARYAAPDAIATLELHKELYGKLTDQQRILYAQLLVPLSGTLTRVEHAGLQVDKDILTEYLGLYSRTQEKQFQEMLGFPEVGKFIQGKRHQNERFIFNPNSSQQLGDLLFNRKYFGLKSTEATPTGKPAIGWDVLKRFADGTPFLNVYRYYKLLDKMLNTYLLPARDEWPSTRDGRVRSNYLIHGAVTGRLASRTPNLQNIPAPEKEPGTILASYPIKNVFVHSFEGGCFLSADYSGMELRTMASVANCRGMIAAFKNDQDLHSVLACRLHGLDFDEFMAKLEAGDAEARALRYRAKGMNFALLYGGDESTLARLMDGVTLREAGRLVEGYYDLFPELLEYREDTLEFARNLGYVESKFGRRRYLPFINDARDVERLAAEREAVNMPIQSSASDILLCAMVVLDDSLRRDNFESKMVNTVHDSILFDVAPGELDDLAELIVEIMEGITQSYGKEWFPGLDFAWFTVPLVVDLETGTHYGNLKSYQCAA